MSIGLGRCRLARAFSGVTQVGARAVGWIPSHHLRLLAYRRLFRMSIGPGTTVYRAPEIRKPSRIEIGRNTVIGNGAVLDGRGGLRIGDNVNFSSGVWVWTMQHDKDSADFAAEAAPVVIGDRAWLSCRTTVLPGVTIGTGAVVCAGAVVTSDVAPYTVVGGVPAKPIGDRSRDLTYTLTGRIPLL
jgi:acetyltransferase-like isoleucine patch superfamily enzyme